MTDTDLVMLYSLVGEAGFRAGLPLKLVKNCSKVWEWDLVHCSILLTLPMSAKLLFVMNYSRCIASPVLYLKEIKCY